MSDAEFETVRCGSVFNASELDAEAVRARESEARLLADIQALFRLLEGRTPGAVYNEPEFAALQRRYTLNAAEGTP